jgi:hypothetical protein
MIEFERDANELVARETKPLSALDEGKDMPLGRLVRYWFSLPRPNGMVPNIDTIGLTEMARLGALGWFHVVDVRNDDPLHYTYDVFALRAGVGYPGIRIAEVRSKALQRALQLDLVRAKSTRFPLFQDVRTHLTGHDREYRRIALPFTSGLDDITHLLLGVHFDH